MLFNITHHFFFLAYRWGDTQDIREWGVQLFDIERNKLGNIVCGDKKQCFYLGGVVVSICRKKDQRNHSLFYIFFYFFYLNYTQFISNFFFFIFQYTTSSLSLSLNVKDTKRRMKKNTTKKLDNKKLKRFTFFLN